MLEKDRLDSLLSDAADSPRLRAHLNLHGNVADPVQRTCVALKQGTYVRPHLHPQENKWELLVVLQGRLGVLLFDANETITERIVLEAGADMSAVELKPNTWHTVFPLYGDVVMLDIKEGPYDPDAAIHFAPWAPEEEGRRSEDGDQKSDVSAFLEWAASAGVGERWIAVE